MAGPESKRAAPAATGNGSKKQMPQSSAHETYRDLAPAASLRPIPTRYRSNHFRSRLEARWAVVFDRMGLPWEYEPQGFFLPSGGSYLPDFRVKLRAEFLWVEVKPNGEKSPKFEEFIASVQDGSKGVILGQVPDPEKTCFLSEHGNFDVYCSAYKDLDTGTWEKGGWYDNYYMFCGCWVCGAVGFEYCGYSDRIGCSCPPRTGGNGEEHPKVLEAFAAGRSARFEHGQRGASF